VSKFEEKFVQISTLETCKKQTSYPYWQTSWAFLAEKKTSSFLSRYSRQNIAQVKTVP
jgi:hypothetical protein